MEFFKNILFIEEGIFKFSIIILVSLTLYYYIDKARKGEDIYIRDGFLNHAWHGDRVIVKITREAIRRRSPEGIVQCVLERSTSNILSLLENEEDNLITYNIHICIFC